MMMRNHPIFTLNHDKETNLVQSFDIAQAFKKYGFIIAEIRCLELLPEKPRISKHEDPKKYYFWKSTADCENFMKVP
ncbi:hypothetical protein TSUD_360910 [Trifolium subterraneum]|uniref:Uncharacterized protein n=1 Tax=Trifolium subterraneum TaxID=3900 RepID=A0A2Z6MBH2_TRISU|nr:hypothetical protein TSUD_360910 [Trifolium subterraneum]